MIGAVSSKDRGLHDFSIFQLVYVYLGNFINNARRLDAGALEQKHGNPIVFSNELVRLKSFIL